MEYENKEEHTFEVWFDLNFKKIIEDYSQDYEDTLREYAKDKFDEL